MKWGPAYTHNTGPHATEALAPPVLLCSQCDRAELKQSQRVGPTHCSPVLHIRATGEAAVRWREQLGGGSPPHRVWVSGRDRPSQSVLFLMPLRGLGEALVSGTECWQVAHQKEGKARTQGLRGAPTPLPGDPMSLAASQHHPSLEPLRCSPGQEPLPATFAQIFSEGGVRCRDHSHRAHVHSGSSGLSKGSWPRCSGNGKLVHATD